MVLTILLFFLFFKETRSQTRYQLYPSSQGNLFENNGKVGLSTSSTFSPFYPAANFNIKLAADISSQFGLIDFDPIFKAELGHNDDYSQFHTTAFVSLLHRTSDMLYGIHQEGPEFMVNSLQNKLSIGYSVPQNDYPYFLSVNGSVLLKDQMTFLHNTRTHLAGITWQTSDLDDEFVFTNFNVQTLSPSYPLILDPISGVTTHGLLQVDSIMLKKDAGVNKVLVSDQYGNGLWTDASLFHDDDWLISSPTLKTGTEPPPVGMPSLYFNGLRYHNVGIGTTRPFQKLHLMDGNMLISRSESNAPGSVNGSILFGEVVTDEYPLGEWGIEYYNEGLNFWKVGNNNWTGLNYCLFLKNNGNIGIGTSAPVSKFQVDEGINTLSIGASPIFSLGQGTSYIGFNASRITDQSSGLWALNSDGVSNGGNIAIGDIKGNFHIITIPSQDEQGGNPQNLTDEDITNHIRLTVTNDGDVGIGTTSAHGYKLAVNGKILCTNLKVQLVEDWPDFVFNKDYSLPSLDEVSKFINDHKHLPGVPSASEVSKDGVDVASVTAGLLKKVEELTLYIIEQQKQIKKQQELIEMLSIKMNSR